MVHGGFLDRASLPFVRPVDNDRQKFASHVPDLRLCCHHRSFVCTDLLPVFRLPRLLYMLGFYMVEFISGSFLREIGICPWDYSAARFQYRGIIRLDYAPLWFAAGLIFEKILTKSA